MRKIPTLFVRDFDRCHGRYVTREVTPGCEWVLAGEGVATRKWDGTCVLVAEDGSLWARREVKPGKPMPGIFRPIETDEQTGKTVGWEPADQSGFAKFIAEAAAGKVIEPGTYELVGPKINGNPDGFAEHVLAPHGNYHLEDVYDRSFDGLLDWTGAHPGVEGIVFWRERGNPDAGMVKIKRRDFLRAGDV